MNGHDYQHEFTFELEHRMDNKIYSERALTKLELFSGLNKKLIYALLSAFINEFDEIIKHTRR